MATKIAVTGATGRLGSQLVDVLEEQGHEVVPIARSKGVDVITGQGLAEALQGVDAVADLATGPSPDEQEATEFFTTSMRNLQEAGAEAGVKRIVLVSIIGIDRSRRATTPPSSLRRRQRWRARSPRASCAPRSSTSSLSSCSTGAVRATPRTSPR